uniref:Autophagy-related protein 9 n=1 Tax=Lepeophtheirus salmonis TaxID=72036 RepID=A0A0K2TJ06_LEPSM
MSDLSDLDRLHTPYSPLICGKDDDEGEEEDSEEEECRPPKPPPIDNVMIHMVPEGSKSRWSHIDDLDSFFKQVYEYHQKNGFSVMILREFMELIQFAFIVFLTTYLWHCIDYDLLFNKKPPSLSFERDKKLKLSDCVYSFGVCVQSFTLTTWFWLFISFSFWTLRVISFCYRIFQFWDIKSFYNNALDIGDEELHSVSWIEVQKRLVEAQTKHSMCIHKEKLSELDIYHRILRFKNYMVAMVNKDLLPFYLNIPFIGDTIFFSQALKFNVEYLLFKSPWAPFDKWHLKEDYKRLHKKKELSESLQSKILLLALLNLILMPVILLYQIVRFFFFYVELVKREPGTLGVRKWSPYARLYLRHFNEHDHELKTRLNRAYKASNTYLDGFVSPVLAVIAHNAAFFTGSILAVFIVLTVWDEDVLSVEHVLTVMTALTGVVAFMRLFIPDDNLVFCPEKSLTSVLAHIHYFPVSWKGNAHTSKVMNNLQNLFPYTFVFLLQEIISPVLTPFILIFYLRPRAPAIVDFFRSFTVSVTGVGDVCSFAQMDCRRHGDPHWQANRSPDGGLNEEGLHHVKAEDGKTEMSLVHFALTNPDWKIPETAEPFINALKEQAGKDAELLPTLAEEENPLYNSLNSLNNVGGIYANLASSTLLDINSHQHHQGTSFLLGAPQGASIIAESSQKPPPPPSLLCSRVVGGSSSLAPPPNLRQDLRRLGLEYTAADMSFSALYLHEMHYRTITRQNTVISGGRRTSFNELEEESEMEGPLIQDLNNRLVASSTDS